mgnify:CR=1 FL=1
MKSAMFVELVVFTSIDLMEQIKQAAADTERLKKLMEDYRDMQDIRNKLAKQLGNNIIV